jgi:multisubunit Na+/H+ antiporter MnhB subunit
MPTDVRNKIRIFMLFEAATFVVASLIHAGVPVGGYEHHEAHLAEAVIALVLIVALALTWIRPAWTRAAGVGGQGFALLGTMVGLFTIAVGVGPRTVPDVAYHIGIVAVLVWGLFVAWRGARS